MPANRFGRIVRSLRIERCNRWTLAPWTQAALADASGLSLATIQNIEQGRRRNLERAELEMLSMVLNLCALERRKFFLAARTDPGLPLIDANSRGGFDQLWALLANVRFPAYLIDPLFSLVGLNDAAHTLYGCTPEQLQRLQHSPIGPHLLEMLLLPRASLFQHAAAARERIVRATLYQFRYTALPYRFHPRFERIVAHLHTYTQFSTLWWELREQPSTSPATLLHHEQAHPTLGELRYRAAIVASPVPTIPLYLQVLLPLTPSTARAFTELGSRGGTPRQLLPWPNPTTLRPSPSDRT